MTTTNIKQFEIGKSYSVHSVCNWDCVWTFKVISRTTSTITLKDRKGEKKTCRINKKLTSYDNVESVMPMGSYSFAPILRADNL
jgi:hypothetical protein